MIRKIMSVIMALVLTFVMGASAFAAQEDVVDSSSYNYFDEIKTQILRGRGTQNVEICNLGLTEYEDGLVCQSVLIVEPELNTSRSKPDGYSQGLTTWATDYWYRGKNLLADITARQTFWYNNKRCVADEGASLFDYNIYYSDTFVKKKSYKMVNGTTARAEANYSVNWNILFKTRTLKVYCDYDGVVSNNGGDHKL